MHDVVIRGGNVVDGSGAPAVTADIAIDGDRISAVGRVGAGKRSLPHAQFMARCHQRGDG
jgi:N-acyl-D-amino-acid deacylase